jgi:hypothetical protein
MNTRTGYLQNLEGGNVGQGLWNSTRKTVVVKAPIVASRHSKKEVRIMSTSGSRNKAPSHRKGPKQWIYPSL